MTNPPGVPTHQTLHRMLDSLPAFPPGHVWLAGAGPGDAGHLTLHALSALAQADHVVFDALVDPAVLALARPGSVREFAGKRGGRPSPTQDDITSRLVALGGKQSRVLRLKGGDPYVFGRGGEEALALARAGIPFRVIPGLTAGLAGLAVAGVPATMRGINRAVVLATGQTADGPDAIDWDALARLGQPIVLYMAVRTLPAIRDRLIAGGLPPTTPAAAIKEATTPRERVLVSTLGALPEAVASAGFDAPAVIVIGEIVRMREHLGGLLDAATAP